MGARPLRRAIQRYVEDPLADFVLREELVPGATVVIDPSPEDDEGEVRLSVVKPKRQKTPVGVGAEGPSPEAELTELTEGAEITEGEGRPEDDRPEDDRPELGDPREQ